jgi:hypothetical protein
MAESRIVLTFDFGSSRPHAARLRASLSFCCESNACRCECPTLLSDGVAEVPTHCTGCSGRHWKRKARCYILLSEIARETELPSNQSQSNCLSTGPDADMAVSHEGHTRRRLQSVARSALEESGWERLDSPLQRGLPADQDGYAAAESSFSISSFSRYSTNYCPDETGKGSMVHRP